MIGAVRNRIDLLWAAFAVGCFVTMALLPTWETIPFHFIWITLTLLYGFRVWSIGKTALILGIVVIATGSAIMLDAFHGLQLWGELFEVPLMSAMFLAMVWHARRRLQALETVEALADERASLLEQEEQLLHDVSHELRTPVTIARGHLELLARRLDGVDPELPVALDELHRIERIVDRLLLLARTERPDLMTRTAIELVPFLEDVFFRWTEVTPRAWRLGEIVDVTVEVDEGWLRTALDALLENAVHYTSAHGVIELSVRGTVDEVVIGVRDDGQGIDPAAIEHVFDRFARTDAARSRRIGGAGLGLAIVDAIARAHGGRCTVRSRPRAGSTFELHLPLVNAAVADHRRPAPDLGSGEPLPAPAR